jgi:hypothetical protein
MMHSIFQQTLLFWGVFKVVIFHFCDGFNAKNKRLNLGCTPFRKCEVQNQKQDEDEQNS